MTTTTHLARASALDPLSSGADRSYVDDLVRVVRIDRGAALPDTGEAVVQTEHFRLRRSGKYLEVSHWFRLDQLDNDFGRILAEELFCPGWLTGNDIFERVFTGVVRSTVRDPLLAWNTFYGNTLAKVRRCWTSRDARPAGSLIADMAPVYERALRFVPPGRVLDVGSCFGFFPLLLAERGENTVTASDIVPGSMRLLASVARARQVDLDTLACDAASVPLPDGSVDTVTVLHLLEHLEPAQGRAVLIEALRLATNWVIVAVPFEDEPSATYGHVRTFDRRALTDLGVASGRSFTVSEFHGGWLVLDAS